MQAYAKQGQIIREATLPDHSLRVRLQLIQLGMTRSGLMSKEAKYLPQIVHPDETIGGVIYGMYQGSFVMMAATDSRIIFLDKKPLFTTQDDINYMVVSGISYGHVGLGSTVTLHTRIQDYTIRTFNQKCAETFRAYIEARCLEQKNPNTNYQA